MGHRFYRPVGVSFVLHGIRELDDGRRRTSAAKAGLSSLSLTARLEAGPLQSEVSPEAVSPSSEFLPQSASRFSEYLLFSEFLPRPGALSRGLLSRSASLINALLPRLALALGVLS